MRTFFNVALHTKSDAYRWRAAAVLRRFGRVVDQLVASSIASRERALIAPRLMDSGLERKDSVLEQSGSRIARPRQSERRYAASVLLGGFFASAVNLRFG